MLELNKTIYFYELHTKATPLSLLDTSVVRDNLYFLKKTFENSQEHKSKDSSTIVDIIEFTDGYLFASVGKLQNPLSNPLMRIRDPKSLECLSENNLQNHLIEDYTYFLIGNNFKDIVVLSNTKAPALKNSLTSAIKEKCNDIENAWISKKLINDLNTTLNKFIKILNIDFACKHEKAKKTILGIKDLKSVEKYNVDKVSLSVTFEKQICDEKFIEDLQSKDYNDFASFKISGITEDGEFKQTLDLISKIITKKVPVNLTKDTLEDLNILKEILLNELIQNIK